MEGGVHADVQRLIAGCSAAGSAPALGAGCRRFESCHSDHVAADGISFAATFLQKSPLIHSVAAPFQIEPAALGFDLVFFSKGLKSYNYTRTK